MIPSSELMKIGMSQKEADIYLALLELGCSDVPTISLRSGVNRTTTYVILEALFEKGIVSSFEKEKKKFFIAESPEFLEKIVHEKESEVSHMKSHFSDILPALMGIFNLAQDKPIVRYYEGEKGMQSLRKHLMSMKKKELFCLVPFDFTSTVSEETINNIKQLGSYLKQKEINRKIIYFCDTEKIKKMTKEDLQIWFENCDYKIMCNKSFPIKSEINIFDDKLTIADVKNGKPLGIMIKESKIVDSFRVFCDMMWDYASKHALKYDKIDHTFTND